MWLPVGGCYRVDRGIEGVNELWASMNEYSAALWWLGIVSAITFVASLVVVPMLLVRIPPDYFCPQPDLDPAPGPTRRPLLKWLRRAGKNLLGVVLILGGLLMLVLPGQGLLTLFVGIALVDFPGKAAVQRRLASQRHVRRAIDWIRKRGGQPPLVFDDPESRP